MNFNPSVFFLVLFLKRSLYYPTHTLTSRQLLLEILVIAVCVAVQVIKAVKLRIYAKEYST
jgi:hypothetical protein